RPASPRSRSPASGRACSGRWRGSTGSSRCGRGDRRPSPSPRPYHPIEVAVDHQVIAKVGRVTGAIEPGRIGEVMIPIRGGSEAYYAYATDPEEAIPKGTRVIVIDHEPPRTVT